MLQRKYLLLSYGISGNSSPYMETHFSIRDHPFGLVHFIYCPSFFFFCLMKDILAKALYISKKGDFHGSGGSLVYPENVIDKLAFETRFVATRGIVSAFSSRDHLGSTGSL